MGVIAVRQKRWALTTILALLLSIFSWIAPAQADDSIEEEIRVKCKNAKMSPQNAKRVAPPTELLKRAPRLITLKTNCGDIVIRPSARNARATVTAITTLINANYYDNTFCHRLSTEDFYALQCGDPTATGLGDPGFSVRSENLPAASDRNYPRGTLAMVNMGRPRTTGSQFYIFYADTTYRPANYTIWGQIISGIEIIEHVAEGGVRGGGTDGMPIRPLVIERIIVR
jgi:peptidyl-prolyl cis-trans isomerase B (cyclophilin B)